MARRTWDETTIEQELATVVGELGRMPTRAELSARGVGGLWDAMRRRGGVAAWAQRVNAVAKDSVAVPADEPQRSPAPSPEAVRERAYLISEREGGGDPVEHWLRAERELRAS